MHHPIEVYCSTLSDDRMPRSWSSVEVAYEYTRRMLSLAQHQIRFHRLQGMVMKIETTAMRTMQRMPALNPIRREISGRTIWWAW